MIFSTNDLGYEDATPSTKPSADELGYGDTTPSATELGYGDDTPSAAELGYGDDTPSAAELGYGASLGYEEATPSATDLGYGEATPSATDLGYGEATPSATELGYGDDPSSSGPELEQRNPTPTASVEQTPVAKPVGLASRHRLRRMGHRSSFGGCHAPSSVAAMASHCPQQRRRVTMDHSVQFHLHQPSHHTMAPRRSSLTNSQQQQRAPRRVSFGGAPVVNHVDKLFSTELEKQHMWYNKQELRKQYQYHKAAQKA